MSENNQTPIENVVQPVVGAEVDAEEIMAQFDRESTYRLLEGFPAKVVYAICLIWAFFQLYTALFGTFPSTLQRAPHIGFALVLAYLLYPMTKKGRGAKKIPFYDLILAAAAACVAGYHVVFYDELLLRSGLFTQTDYIVSLVAVVLVLEAARRVVGPVIVVIASLFLAYALVGGGLPGFLGHAGLSLKRVSTMEWLGTEGILGSPIYVSSTFIFLFMIFAAFLGESGIGDWMTDMAMSGFGHHAGGPAKAAVVASALEGSASGSSVANVVGSGSITIPLMKSIGYPPEFAGAVEATASTGGQLVPPILGAAAFIMTEYIGVPYITIVIGAIIPAILYFSGVFANVHFEALKQGLRGLPRSQLKSAKALFKRGWYMILPLIMLFWLLGSGRSVMRSALFAVLGCTIVWAIELWRAKEFGAMSFAVKVINGLAKSSRSAISVAIACGCAGTIVGVITKTGLGMKLAGGILGISGGNLMLTMIFSAIGCMVVGMGVPTTANYIIQATISAPALVLVGVPPLAAHMFVFYYGIVADITPPVALASFAGAGIAGADPMKTSFNAARLGTGAYLVPFLFVASPELLFVRTEGEPMFSFVLAIVIGFVTALLGMTCIAAGTTGFFKLRTTKLERLLLIVGGFGMFLPYTVTTVGGIIMYAGVWFLQTARQKKGPLATA